MKRHPSTFLLILVVVALVACAGSTGGLGSVPSPVSTPVASTAPTSADLTPAPSEPAGASTAPSGAATAEPGVLPTPVTPPSGTMTVRSYFVLGGDPGSVGLVPVLRIVPKTAAVGAAAMNALLKGPDPDVARERTITTAIPAGTRLLDLAIKSGVATVDLSTEFDSGGGSASLQYRLAQVVYTLTQYGTVRSVVFQIEGQTVTVFGSEGIVLDGPVARADYTDQLPAIFVDRPAYGAALSNPGDVRGTADVFEATFRVAILDGSGASIVDRQVMASCGTGCRGTFAVSLPHSVAKAQWGTLRVYDLSAKDGTPENSRDYPVWLTQAN
jgi:spore germination protein GerM